MIKKAPVAKESAKTGQNGASQVNTPPPRVKPEPILGDKIVANNAKKVAINNNTDPVAPATGASDATPALKEKSGWNFSPEPTRNAAHPNGAMIKSENGGDSKKYDEFRAAAEQKRKREEILKKENALNRSRSNSPAPCKQKTNKIFHLTRQFHLNFKCRVQLYQILRCPKHCDLRVKGG